MKVTFHRESLLKTIRFVARAVSPRDYKPLLQCILFDATKNSCEVEATDLTVTCRMAAGPCAVAKEGKEVINAKALLHVLQWACGEEITIEPKKITCGSDVWKFNSILEPDDYPCLVRNSTEESLIRERFVQAVNRSYFAAAQEGTIRFGATTGIRLEFEKGVCRLVATDGRRLSVCHMPWTGSQTMNAVAEVKALTLARDIATQAKGDISVAVPSENIVGFYGPGWAVVSTQVTGKFPNWVAVLPKSFQCEATVSVPKLLAAIRRVNHFCDDENPSLYLNFSNSPGEGEVQLECRGNLGDATTKIDAQVKGADIKIIYDPKYLIEVLDSLEFAGTIKWQIGGAITPCVLSLDNFEHIIVPRGTTR